MVKKAQFINWLMAGCILTAMIGCSDKNRIPSGVLPREKMQKVLWDMIQADRFASTYLLKDSATKNVKAETFKLYEQVFQVNEVTKEEFVESYQYYLSRPDITKVMLDSLAAEANRTREAMYRDTAAKAIKPVVADTTTKPVKPVIVDSAAKRIRPVAFDSLRKRIRSRGVDTAAQRIRPLTIDPAKKRVKKPE